MPLLRRDRPLIYKDVAFLAPCCSTLIGSVYIGAGSLVFYKSILRVDNCENAESFKRTDDEIIQEEWELDDERFIRKHIRRRLAVASLSAKIQIFKTVVFCWFYEISHKDWKWRYRGPFGLDSFRHHSRSLLDWNHGIVDTGRRGLSSTKNHVLPPPGGERACRQYSCGEAGELWVGNPARKVRDLTSEEWQKLYYYQAIAR
jgi:hypothetical protein